MLGVKVCDCDCDECGIAGGNEDEPGFAKPFDGGALACDRPN